ncbi:hypothetical protein AVEN_212979-1 [Araneus ventricosus]|uniref:Uncharacterized protein n=1 Tax=Araneus ventricosus TaxID=182803 RepID=A0A4Y2W3B2_ARAVE|nr:hypothetical protein AVEN_193581-1 [Araneus ventricosus]GBO31046.1 hypothetical protein AVEN_9767-1 [Araneus ventricosus]GBO31049.1 hypothetical protein AVEN_47003-1 [Araneus ventricosus]GBO31052.1 hypothetical protein AVEN_212979-1 [Araneus ventricosus]
MRYTVRSVTAPPGANNGVCSPISKRVQDTAKKSIIKRLRFSTKRHLVHINTKSRTLKMHICLFAFSETAMSQNMDKGENCILRAKNDTIILYPVGITQIAGVWTFPAVLQDFR